MQAGLYKGIGRGCVQAFAKEALTPETDVEGEDIENLAGGKFRVASMVTMPLPLFS